MTDAPAARPVLNGRYELHRRIARGGMADVFLAKDQLLDRPVAVKVLFPQFAAEESFVARFRREAQAAANLNHPNIVAVYDWGQHEDTYFIVMEYIEGQTLAELIASQGHLEPTAAADIAVEVAAALGFAHRNGTVHRDVKPGNIMINQSGQVKVADFGIARAFGGGDDELTQTGSVMGTASYFSPEQAQGKPVDPRSDLYALGVVLFEMLVGEPPFIGQTPVAIAFKHVQEFPARVAARNPSVPAALDAVVDRLLRKDPAERYPAAEQLQADLRRYRAGQPLTGVTEPVAANGYGQVGAADPTLAAPIDGPSIAAHQAVPVAPQATGVDPTMAMAAGQPGVAPMRAADTGRSRAVIDTSRAVPASAALTQEEPVEEYYETPSRPGVFVVMLAILLAALVVLILYISSTLSSDDDEGTDAVEVATVPVVDVVGKTFTDAQVDLRVEGFEVVIELEENPAFEPNVVFRQDPAAGTEAEPNSVVTIFVSKGADTERIPDLDSIPADEAEAALEAIGLQVDIQFEANDVIPEDQVIRTEPAENTEVNVGSRVLLIVSSGPSQVQVPTVAGMDQITANATLEGAKLDQIEIRGEGSGVVDFGRVIRTEPEAGQLVDIDATIIVYVSSGPDEVQMPSVIGLSPEAAATQLGGDQLQLQVQLQEQPLDPGDQRIGLVVNTNPQPGSTVLQGSTVNVFVGVERGEPTTETTQPTSETTETTNTTETTTTTSTTTDPDG